MTYIQGHSIISCLCRSTPPLFERQMDQLLPASIRAVVRCDENPWAAVNGTTDIEREPSCWLQPCRMGRYLKMIQ